jgi:hypothetical protein
MGKPNRNTKGIEGVHMTIITIEITPLGPTHFGIRGLTTPSVVARDDVWIAPPPSTLLGMLGNTLGIYIQNTTTNNECSTCTAEAQLKQLAETLKIEAVWGS